MRHNVTGSILLLAILALFAPRAAGAHTITLEGESYSSSYDYAGGVIETYPLTGCSSGYVIMGLDAAAEWVQYDMTVDLFGSYYAQLVLRGDLGIETRIRLEVTPSSGGPVMEATFIFTGTGYG